MTHDELRDCIDKFDAAGMVNEPTVKALRAVVELHKPSIFNGKETSICTGCEQCWGCGEWGSNDDCDCDRYPCKTIQAIEKELI